MKGSVATIVIVIVCVIALIGMGAYLYFGGTSSTQTTTQNSSMQPSPTIPVKDYAPGLSMSQKTTILIQTSDSSDIKYIVPTSQVSTYVKSLPPGYKVVSERP
jgi:hypothetical protein